MSRVRPIAALVLLPLLGASCVSEARMKRASARVDLGGAYLKEKNPEGAIAALREAVKLDPRNWRARSTLAMAYAAKGQPELAEESFLAALRINPDEGEILMNYGAFLVQQGRPAEAVVPLEKALDDLDYRSPAMVLSNLARAHLDAGEPEKALVRAQDAVRRAPTLCPAIYHLGLAQEALGRTDAALHTYDDLTRTCPDEAIGGWLRAGCLMQRMGDASGADVALGVVVDKAAGTPLADEARNCLARAGG
jgi:type IV pilus assembly protein PilF